MRHDAGFCQVLKLTSVLMSPESLGENPAMWPCRKLVSWDIKGWEKSRALRDVNFSAKLAE